MPGDDAPHVLDPQVALDHADGQVAELTANADDSAD